MPRLLPRPPPSRCRFLLLQYALPPPCLRPTPACFNLSSPPVSHPTRCSQVLLDPPRAELERRLLQRAAEGGHFTPGAALLDSQLAALQYEEAELLLHVRGEPFPAAEDIVAAVLARCGGGGA